MYHKRMGERFLSYDDIALVPNFFEGTTRSELDTSVLLGLHKFKLPVIPANMKCVIDKQVARDLHDNGYFYIMHRFGVDNFEFVQQCTEEGWLSSISLGVKPNDMQLVDKLVANKLKPDYITVDVAHGHCQLMQEALTHIKRALPDTFVIAGNVATARAYLELVRWGADAVKVGIGPGKACVTRLKTGFFTPMFSTIQAVAECAHTKPIIADGGIQHHGDIAKALVAGANMVMIGSLFAQCIDSPAQSASNNQKLYFGSASAENKGHNRNIEGVKIVIDSNGMTVLEKMEEITQDLQSAISYAGGTLSQFTNWIKI